MFVGLVNNLSAPAHSVHEPSYTVNSAVSAALLACDLLYVEAVAHAAHSRT